ncbi:MAG: hypothetical protein EXQ95_15560 [Alphaproteobacteria bacterium]|nr:hypothetical protein [Alphaproteobacteria bacterium]
MRRVLPLLLLLIAGCAPVGYARPGASPAQTEADERDCRSLALREIRPLLGATPYGYPYRPYRPLLGDPLLDRMRSESDLADFCMRARGYVLRRLS